MIQAHELREITATSQKQVADMIAKIEPQLVLAAQAGKRHYACYSEGQWDCIPTYAPIKTDVFQQLLIDELKKNGFGAKVEADGDHYVPRGLAGDDGDDGPKHQNHVLIIRW